jgi:GT2 family glycosyltransferase
MTPLVYAVVTHWNALDDTTECVTSVLTSEYDNLATVIVDNGSSNGSADILEQRFPQVTVLRTGENGAITAAYNWGMQFALDNSADYVLMLNNDIAIHPQMVSLLVAAAERDDTVGVVTPKTYYYDRPDIIWFAGGQRSRFDFGSLQTHEGERDAPANSRAGEVDYAWASGMLFKRELLQKMGLFDTRFYLYYDDVDICIRAQQAGYRIWYEPNALMWHKVSHSTGSARFTRIWARSKMRLFRKHARGLHQAVLIAYAFGHGAVRAVIPREDNMRMRIHPKAYFLGLVDGLRRRDPSV